MYFNKEINISWIWISLGTFRWRYTCKRRGMQNIKFKTYLKENQKKKL